MSHCLTYSILRQLRKKNVPLLDSYGGATVAYSLRKLDSDYTGYCIKVRRSSDDTLQDIGFNSQGGVNKTNLLSFIGNGDGFIHTWYDQSGNGNDATQTTTSYQPQIVNGGLIYKEKGFPTIHFDSSMLDTSSTNWTNGYWSSFLLGSFSIGGGIKVLWNAEQTIRVAQFVTVEGYFPRTIGFNSSGGYVTDKDNAISVNQPYLFSALKTDGYLEIFTNTSSNGPTIMTDTNINLERTARIGAYGGTGSYWHYGNISEIIHYGTDQSTNRSNIELNINNFYSIY